MKSKLNSWKNYLIERGKKIVMTSANAKDKDVNYGREVYASEKIARIDDNKVSFFRWVVYEFENEFNVFYEKSIDSRNDKYFAASFTWKEKAIKFALEMLLVSSGKMKRGGSITS